MADAPVVHIGENSPEYVAYKLMVNIAATEGFHIRLGPMADREQPTRKWILDTYAECLEAVKGFRQR